MRRVFGQSLRIDVSPQKVSVQCISRWRGWRRNGASAPVTLAAHTIAPSAEHPFDAIANALRALLGELGVDGWPVAIVLADELTRMWRVTPPPGAARMSDLEAAAGLRFQWLYGEAPVAWQVCADWNASRPFFAAAVPHTLLAALRGVAQDCKLSIVAVEPRFVSAWNRSRRVLKPGAWFGDVHDKLLTLAVTDANDQGLCAIRALPIPHGADHSWLTQTLQREALLLDIEAPSLLQVHGSAPAAWTRPVASAAHIACMALAGSSS